MSSSDPPPSAKSSSEILNELFSTFNTSFSSSAASSSHEKKILKKSKKKKRSSSAGDNKKSSLLKKKKKKKLLLGSSSSQEKVSKKKKKSLPGSSSQDKAAKSKKKHAKLSSSPPKKPVTKKTKSTRQVIGDGFVILKNSGYNRKELEDGEIVDEGGEGKSSNKKRRASSDGAGPSKKTKLSASQAYKLDAEERLLLGYDGGREGSSSKSSSSSSSHPHDDHHHHKRKRSKSPTRPRLAPPREVYKSSYQRFEKEHNNEHHHQSSSGSSGSSRQYNYDSASYYDYHAQRGRSSYSSSRGGFGYVGKSYYYDDVEGDKKREEDCDDDRRRRRDYHDSSRDHRTSSSSWRQRSRSPTTTRRSYYHPDDIIDKTELLEIARKNANKLMSRGVLPSDIFSRDQILALKAGGKSVEELTLYCKRLAKRDACGDATDRDDDSDDEGSGGGRRREHFVHHPFVVKDKPLPTIRLNIRNAVPLPVRTPQELAIDSAKLRTQFPVSSGTQHRFKEIEWKPVQGDKKEGETAIVPLASTSSISSATGPNVATVAPMVKEVVAEEEKKDVVGGGGGEEKKEVVVVEGSGEGKREELDDDAGISVDGPDLPLVDIGSVIGLRLKAMRLLQENPGSGDAQRQLDEATQMMKYWADAKALEPKFLTPAELCSGPQAWAKRDQLRKTRALDSGMGMHLLQKMGWKPGEGLGKNKEGQLEPLALDVKTDKKGLTAAVEELMYGKGGGGGSSSRSGPSMPVVYDLSGKHPVSALMELTAKRRWGNPEFELCFEHGPPHKRQFVYKVIVNGVEYQPCVAVGNKKQAKANAAAFCLQSLGLLPAGAAVGSGESLQTVEGGGGVTGPVNNSDGGGGGSGSLLAQAFSGSGSFLQTVVGDSNSSGSGSVGGDNVVVNVVEERELMPPPPVPPPLMKFLR